MRLSIRILFLFLAYSACAAPLVFAASVSLSWDPSTDDVGVSGYYVFRSTVSGGPYAQIGSSASTLYIDATVQNSATYYYVTQSYDARDNRSVYSNEVAAVVPSATPSAPQAPTGLNASPISSSQVNLSWVDASTDEDGFKIERKTGISGTYAQIATTTANIVSYQNTGLSASTQYYYRIRAYNSGGNSGYSNEANATTQAASSLCGNGAVNSGEQCDGANLNNQTCVLQGFIGGALSCNSNCTFNTSACLSAPQCTVGQILCGSVCTTPVCTSSAGCNDNNPSTTDSCTNAGLCNAGCSYAPIPTGGSSGGGGGSGGGSSSSPIPLSVTLTASPQSSAQGPFTVTLVAQVMGDFSGTINYTFYCNRNDPSPTITQPYDKKIDNVTSRNWTMPSACAYTAPGTYVAKVIVENGESRAEGRVTIQSGGPPAGAPQSGGAASQNQTLKGIKLVLSKNLQFGMKDLDVTKMQQFLKTLGYFTYPDFTTFFGNVTLRAVVEYQQVNGISPALGFVGPVTRAHMASGNAKAKGTVSAPAAVSQGVSLARNLWRGLSGSDVKLLQEKLKTLGFFPAERETTEFFGLVTEGSVQKFQCARLQVCSGSPEISGYGVAGPKTRAELAK